MHGLAKLFRLGFTLPFPYFSGLDKVTNQRFKLGRTIKFWIHPHSRSARFGIDAPTIFRTVFPGQVTSGNLCAGQTTHPQNSGPPSYKSHQLYTSAPGTSPCLGLSNQIQPDQVQNGCLSRVRPNAENWLKWCIDGRHPVQWFWQSRQSFLSSSVRLCRSYLAAVRCRLRPDSFLTAPR